MQQLDSPALLELSAQLMNVKGRKVRFRGMSGISHITRLQHHLAPIALVFLANADKDARNMMHVADTDMRRT